MTMSIIRPEWSRTFTMQSWSLGNDFYIIYITAPARDKGQIFMKRKNEMWNWMPTINRMIKIPPSMMMQSWMGSDFSNDDVVRANSIVEDYTHRMIGEKEIEGLNCYEIELIPLDDAPVVWGKVIMWIAKEKYFQLQTEYYDDYMELVNIAKGSEIEMMDGKEIPTLLSISPVDKPKNITELKITYQDFDIPSITKSFFSQQNMKRIRPRNK
ncbi:MAG: outer membrane lipoprotein-sorting protein [Bacteroidetes bacterium]|nr:outer membrane lipoprotein-sorting protein [Bacteroidota bacterium]